ncbi:MAG: outer membrane lipoprotein carrier protein LolA [Chthoniobacteraceae bacterium]
MKAFPLFRHAVQPRASMRGLCTLALAAACLTGSILPTHATELTPDQRAALLTEMQAIRDKQPGARAHFREQKQSHLMKQPLISEGTVAFSSPDKFRREITGESASLTVSDGKTLWIYYPNFQEAEKYTIGQRAFFDDSLSALTAGMNFTHIEDFYKLNVYQEDGGYRFVLVPKKSNLKRLLQQLTIWLDKDYLLKKTEIIMPSGDKSVTDYTGTERVALPVNTFTFNPPTGTRVTTPLGK